MITPDDFALKWGPGLVRPSEAALSDVVLPEPSRRFLLEAGLPAASDPLPFRFAFPAEGLPMLDSVPDPPDRPEIGDRSRFRVIGRDHQAFVCIDESTGGRIVSVLANWTRPVRLLNSSVEQLAQFLLVFRAIRVQGLEEEANATAQLVAQTRQQAQASEEERLADRARRAEGLRVYRLAREQEIRTGREVMTRLKEGLREADPGVFAQDNSVWLEWIDDMETMGGLT